MKIRRFLLTALVSAPLLAVSAGTPVSAQQTPQPQTAPAPVAIPSKPSGATVGAPGTAAKLENDLKLQPAPKLGPDGFTIPETDPNAKPIDYLYDHPTLNKLAQLYWALGMLDIHNDRHIDNFLMINECDMFNAYSHDEFEWEKIRAATRKFITENTARFPLRFELMQEIHLGDYDTILKRFIIPREFKVDGMRRFETMMDHYDSDTICGFDTSGRGKTLEGYPRGIIVNLTRPVILNYVPVEPDVAKTYINDSMEAFKALKTDILTEENVIYTRTAYMDLKVKLFSFKQYAHSTEGFSLAEMMAILEGIEIYADPGKRILLYSIDYRHKRKPDGDLEALQEDNILEGEVVADPNPNHTKDAQGASSVKPADATAPKGPAPVEIPAWSPDQ